MKIEKVNINDLISPSYNPRTITDTAMESLKTSINTFGYITPIIVNRYNNHVVGGNQRLVALKQLGYDEVEVIFIDEPDINKEKAINIRLNNLSGEWDNSKLEVILQEIQLSEVDISLTGFNDIELQDLNITEDEPQEIIEDDYTEEIENPLNIKEGDLYQLGNHRLLCGDCTDENNLKKLMDGNNCDLLFTDPPYNVQFNGRSGKFEIIENDNLTEDEFNQFIIKVTSIIKKLNPTHYYIWCNWKFYGILQDNLDFKSCIVWAKNVFGLGKGYRHQHEFCLFNGEIDKDITNETDLWEIKKDNNYVHPTQKPVELCARALGNHHDAVNILDLFGGSGSTLIACEQLNRTCYMAELDPHYINVIIQRWEQYTGEKAEFIKNINND